MKAKIGEIISESLDVKNALFLDKDLHDSIMEITKLCTNTFQTDGKILFCGNGGSAADAQHLAAELSGRFYLDRPPLFAEALHVNTSFLTAVANDYGYDNAFARMVQAMGRKGDVLFALSTSGNSPNILNAVDAAKQIGMITIGMTGLSGGKLNAKCDFMLKMPSNVTPRIQECHILVGHIICELIEADLFGNSKKESV